MHFCRTTFSEMDAFLLGVCTRSSHLYWDGNRLLFCEHEIADAEIKKRIWSNCHLLGIWPSNSLASH